MLTCSFFENKMFLNKEIFYSLQQQKHLSRAGLAGLNSSPESLKKD